MSSPYLPYILKEVVAKVSTTFSTRLTDPFSVFFDYGFTADVSKRIYKKDIDNVDTYPLVWLVDNWATHRGDAGGNYGEVTFQLVLAMPTDLNYTPDEKSTNIYLKRLIPVYDELVYRISKSSQYFSIQSLDRIKHTVEKIPYQGENIGGTNSKNLFGNFIDVLHISSMSLILK
jgi:hypothetical protein